MDPPFATHAQADAYLRAAGHVPADPSVQPLAEAREVQQRYFHFLAAEVPAVGQVADHWVPGPHGPVRVRLYYPARGRARVPIVFVRGGGLWAGTQDAYARTMALICNLSGLPVCGIDYRPVPEHAYPTQQREVEAAVCWLAERAGPLGLAGDGAILWGESAGASLAVCAALELHAARRARVRGLVLLYGNFAGPLQRSRPQSLWAWRHYLGEADETSASRAVPLRRAAAGLPAVWLGAGGADPLLADSCDFAAHLGAAGVPCELRIYPAMPHGFVMMNRILQPAMQALEDAAGSARKFVGHGPREDPVHHHRRPA